MSLGNRCSQHHPKDIMLRSTSITSLALGALLAVTGCTAPAALGQDDHQGADQPVAVTKEASTKHHLLVLGSHADIAARRLSVAPTYARGVSSPLKAGGPSAFVPSSATYFANARKNAGLSVTLAHDSAGTLLSGAATVRSSDPSVATASLSGSEVTVELTQKVGNTFITTYDASGNALAKFMVLSATPKSGVAIIDDDNLAPSALFGGGNDQFWPVTNFADRTDDGGLNFLYQPSGAYGGMLTIDAPRGGTQKLQAMMNEVVRQVGGAPIAIYFPGRDILVRLSNRFNQTSFWDRSFKDQDKGYTEALPFAQLVAQDGFADYVDYGNSLSSSPLHDTAQVEDASYEFVAPKGQKAVAPKTVAVVLADGTRVAATSPDFAAAKQRATRVVLAYPEANGNLEEGGLECTVKAGTSLSWKSVSTNAQTTIDGSSSWNGGKPDVSLSLHPHMTFGGQFEFQGAVQGSCERTLFTVPIAEWGIPVFGKVALNVPVAAKFEVSAKFGTTKTVIMTPRLNVGSKADPSKPGNVSISYKSTGGGFGGSMDVGTRTDYASLGVVVGSDAGKTDVDVQAGVSAGIGFEASVKLWIAKASIRADVGYVLFGVETSGTMVVDDHKQFSVEDGKFSLGMFPHIAPSISVSTPFYTHSFNLFDQTILPIRIYSTTFGAASDDLMPEEKSTTVHVDGRDLQIIFSSDAVTMPGLKDTDNAEYVIGGWFDPTCRHNEASGVGGGGHGSYIEYFRIPFKNGVANITGIDLRNADKCALDYSTQEVDVNGSKATSPYQK